MTISRRLVTQYEDIMETTQKTPFQAEIQQLLDIVIHSLYSEKEVFVRELISNAADACEKLRFIQASGQPIYQPDGALKISITVNEKENSITISDTGVGMTEAELVANLGTIAHSGTKTFLKRLQSPEGAANPGLIGQFGVGFYSAFMVADTVVVTTRSYLPQETGRRWSSGGADGYEIEQAEVMTRGTQITITLKSDAKKFLEESEIERIIHNYSNFIQFPIELNGKAINTIKAIWARNKNEINDEEYKQFYQYLTHTQEPPLSWLHFVADAPLAIQALLFVPAHNPELMGMSRMELAVSLYSRKVLIQRQPVGLLPDWLRFLKGVVDSEDLRLNISREAMQESALMPKLQKVLTSRFLKFLNDQAENDREAHERFYAAFNRYLKEGIMSDFAYVAELGRLLLFETSTLEPGKKTSFAEYVKRMAAEQKEIYYFVARNREAAESSAYHEAFRSEGYEVIFLYEPIDEFVMERLHAFDEKSLIPVEKAEIALSDSKAAEGTLSHEESESLAQWIKKTLGESVGSVRVTRRLVDSPAAIFENDKFMTSSRRQLLRSMKMAPGASPVQYDLEINPKHLLINRLNEVRQSDEELAGKITEQILDNAKLAAGTLDDTRLMLKRLNSLLQNVIPKAGSPG